MWVPDDALADVSESSLLSESERAAARARPRGLQGRVAALHAVLGALWSILDAAIRPIGSPTLSGRIDATPGYIVSRNATCATGCETRR